jgi:hypothetical protein
MIEMKTSVLHVEPRIRRACHGAVRIGRKGGTAVVGKERSELASESELHAGRLSVDPKADVSAFASAG